MLKQEVYFGIRQHMTNYANVLKYTIKSQNSKEKYVIKVGKIMYEFKIVEVYRNFISYLLEKQLSCLNTKNVTM